MRQFATALLTTLLCFTQSTRGEATWWDLDGKTVAAQGPALLQNIQALIGATPEETRKSIEEYLANASASPYRWTNIYILNRLYFAVPEKIAAKDQVFIGWEYGGDPARRPASDEAMVDALYPLEIEAGRARLVGHIHTSRGKPYPVLREFDEFHKRYGLRPERPIADSRVPEKDDPSKN